MDQTQQAVAQGMGKNLTSITVANKSAIRHKKRLGTSNKRKEKKKAEGLQDSASKTMKKGFKEDTSTMANERGRRKRAGERRSHSPNQPGTVQYESETGSPTAVPASVPLVGKKKSKLSSKAVKLKNKINDK